MAAQKFSIIIPSKNDEKVFYEHYSSVTKYLKSINLEFEIILVSNGSTAFNLDLVSDINDINFLHLNISKSGKGLAIKHGIKNAKYENILFIDADFSVPITEIEKFIKNDNFTKAVLIGSRRSPESINKDTPVFRRIGGSVYLFFANFLLGVKLTDTQCGFKVFSKSEYFKLEEILFDNFSFDIELLYKFSQNNSIIEIPVDYKHNNDSNVNMFKDSLVMLIDLLKLRLRK